MNERVERAITESSADFLRLVWPAIGRPFGQVIPVETVTDNDFARQLDQRAGIDVWLVGNDGHMRGLASRVQWQPKSWDTFTVRVRARYGGATEYHKRSAEITARNVITPYYFTQGYVSRDRTELLGAAIARTADVIAAVDHDMGRLLPPNSDGSQGYAVPWSALKVIEVWKPDVSADDQPVLFEGTP